MKRIKAATAFRKCPEPPRPARGRIPFPDHRTQAEVRQDEEINRALCRLAIQASREAA